MRLLPLSCDFNYYRKLVEAALIVGLRPREQTPIRDEERAAYRGRPNRYDNGVDYEWRAGIAASATLTLTCFPK